MHRLCAKHALLYKELEQPRIFVIHGVLGPVPHRYLGMTITHITITVNSKLSFVIDFYQHP